MVTCISVTFYEQLISHQNCITFNFTMISEGLKEIVNSCIIHLSYWDDAEQNWVISHEIQL